MHQGKMEKTLSLCMICLLRMFYLFSSGEHLLSPIFWYGGVERNEGNYILFVILVIEFAEFPSLPFSSSMSPHIQPSLSVDILPQKQNEIIWTCTRITHWQSMSLDPNITYFGSSPICSEVNDLDLPFVI